MKKYRTLFYHSKWGDKKWIDNAIALTTQAYRLWDFKHWDIIKLGFSHEEIWIPQWQGSFDTVDYGGFFETIYEGTCYTSTMGQVSGKNREGNGTCKRPASKVLKHPERWSYTEHEVGDLEFDAMIRYLDYEVEGNQGYGLGHDKNVCSELSHNANVVSGELSGSFRFVSPLTDAILMVDAGKKLINLKG